MKNTKKVTALVLALLLTLSLSSVAFATAPTEYGIGGNPAQPGTTPSDGSTTVGIVSTTVDVTTLNTSVTVPLYVTLAVTGDGTSGNGKVWAPKASSYAISNTAAKGNVGVTGLQIDNVATNSWALSATVPTTAYTAMQLMLNDVPLTPGSNTTSILATANKGLAGVTPAVPAAIAAKGKKEIQFKGAVAPQWAANGGTDMKATAQWKLTYTISPTDAQGNPILVYTYAGNTQTYTWDGTAFTTQGAFAP